ncbi:MAG: ABC transporter permease [Deltaproteobacteria bacterium]|nr:ABC transporter permease [Deltaproteobacteria bacterium]
MFVLGTLKEFFLGLFQYREYLKQSIIRELRKKYKRSILGYLWSMLQPLFMMIILAMVFSEIMKSDVKNYAVFLFCAMLPWGFFEHSSMQCLSIIRVNARIIEQLPVPKFIFPLSAVLYNLVNFFLTLVPLILVMLITNHPFTWKLALFPFMLVPLFCFTLGISMLLSVLNIFFDDTQHLTQVLLRALYFLCPIIYGKEHIPVSLLKWVSLNPLFPILEGMRSIIYSGAVPNLADYCYSLWTSLLILLLGLLAYKKASDKFIYFI